MQQQQLLSIDWAELPDSMPNLRTTGPQGIEIISSELTEQLQQQLDVLQTNIHYLLQLHEVVMDSDSEAIGKDYKKKYPQRKADFESYLQDVTKWRQEPPTVALLDQVRNLRAALQSDQIRLNGEFLTAAANSAYYHNYLRQLVSSIGYVHLRNSVERTIREITAIHDQIQLLLASDNGKITVAKAAQIIQLHEAQYVYGRDIVQKHEDDRAGAQRVEWVVLAASIIVLVMVAAAFIYSAWWFGKNKEVAMTWDLLKDHTMLGIPLGIVLWSILGSLAAMIHRYYKGSAYSFISSDKWVFVRPAMGVLMASVVYMAFFALFAPEDEAINPFLMLLLGFFVGYSDKFSMSLMQVIQDTLGALFKSEEPPAPPAAVVPTPATPVPEKVVVTTPAAPQPAQPKNVPEPEPEVNPTPPVPPRTDPDAGEDEST